MCVLRSRSSGASSGAITSNIAIAAALGPLGDLSPRELSVFRLIAEGHTNRAAGAPPDLEIASISRAADGSKVTGKQLAVAPAMTTGTPMRCAVHAQGHGRDLARGVVGYVEDQRHVEHLAIERGAVGAQRDAVLVLEGGVFQHTGRGRRCAGTRRPP